MLLLSAGYDLDNSIVVHDWIAKRLVATAKTGKGKINGLAWKNENENEFVIIFKKYNKR